ncbi:MAG: hypothetical protein ACRC7C_19860 [Beijerinckiaceae bacterium]
MQITATIGAWINLEYSAMDRMTDAIKTGDHEQAVNEPMYSLGGLTGYTQVGTAEITLTLFPQNDIQGKQLEALNEQLQVLRAENQRKENYLLDKISKLSALTYEAEA